MTAAAFTPPAPAPRYIPPNAKPSLQGYVRYFKIMANNPLEIFTEANFNEFMQTSRVFGQDYAIVHDPDAVRRVLVSNASNYRLTKLRRALFEPLIGDGLLIAEDELWSRTRKALTPVFNHRNVQGFGPLMRDAVARKADAIATKDGHKIALSEEMLTLALDVLIACLFSADDNLDTARFSRNLDRLLRIAGMPHPLDLMDAPTWLPRLGRGEARTIVAEIRSQVGDLLRSRRSRSDAGRDEKDFLSLLMKAGAAEGSPLSDKEIIDNLITFLAAGHETTARTLTWTFYLLSQDQASLARLRDEVNAAKLDETNPAGWGAALPFATAVIKESMRLYPAAAVFSRLAVEDDELCGNTVKGGTEIVISPWVLHRHRKLWDAPDIFKPDRFMGAAGEAIPRHAYIPFGAGPRICIGASFSMQEMLIVLVEFLRRLDLEHVGASDPQPIMRITVQPSTPVLMRVVALN